MTICTPKMTMQPSKSTFMTVSEQLMAEDQQRLSITSRALQLLNQAHKAQEE